VSGDAKRQQNLETIVSTGILLVLVVIAAGIFLRQYHYYPAVLQPDMQSLYHTTAHQTGPPSAAETALIPPPEGIRVLSSPEFFDRTNISDKINGKADLYLSAGLESLRSQRFALDQTPELWLEMYVYDMQKEQNAFSVFSVQRRADAETLELTPNAYGTPNALFFTHGSYYLEIIASRASPELTQAMHDLAGAFVENNPIQEQTAAMEEKNLFPRAGLVPNSISRISEDAFGYEALDRIFTATYSRGDDTYLAFLSRRQSPQEAAKLAENYYQFLTMFGGEAVETTLDIPEAKLVSIADLDTYEIIFRHGRFFAGVREAPDQSEARKLALELYQILEKLSSER
jgi:hypothetical protein